MFSFSSSVHSSPSGRRRSMAHNDWYTSSFCIFILQILSTRRTRSGTKENHYRKQVHNSSVNTLDDRYCLHIEPFLPSNFLRDPSCPSCFIRFSSIQLSRVMAQMVFHESRDKKIAVIVTFMTAQGQRLAGIPAGGLEDLRIELIGEEFVRQSLIDQNRAGEPRLLHQLAGIVFAPRRRSVAEITLERLLPPGTARRRGDRRECG